MNALGLLARIALSSIIIFQLSIGQALAAAGDGSGQTQSDNPGTRYALELLKTADQIDNGEFFNQNPKNFDVFKLADQRVEIFANNKVQTTFSLNDHRVEKPILSYTNLKPRYDITKKELIFEATRGQAADGTGGTIVARHIIPDMDIVAMNHDRSMLMYMDSKGKLHSIDMGYVIGQVFNSPIPSFRNLWESQKDVNLTAGNVQLEFLTRGVRPIADNVDMNDVVVPLDKNGQKMFTAGDLLVRVNDGGTERVLGLFSREVTTKRMQEGTALLAQLAALVTPDTEVLKFFSTNEQTFEKIIQEKADNIVASPKVTSYFENFDINQLKSLSGRLLAFEAQATGKFDKFTTEEWKSDYAEYKKILEDSEKIEFVAKRAHLLQDKAVGDEIKKIYREAYASFLGDAEGRKRLAESDALAKNWQVLTEPAQRVDPLAKKDKTKALKGAQSERVTEWKYVGVVATMVAAYLGGAFAFTHIESLQQVSAISWIYEHLYFDVMKDMVYRYPLTYSIISWIGVWPVTLAASFGFEKTLNIAGASVKNSDTAFAKFIRDFQKTWGPLTDWQRIISLGMRGYSYVVYPYLRAFVEGTLIGFVGLRQKAFFSAYDHGMNPFKKIMKDSELGRQMGLEKNEYLGLNNPVKKSNDVERKIQMQSALSKQNIRIESLSWMLATLAVSEKSGIDPATLLQASQKKVTPEQIRNIFSDTAKQREWELLSQEISKAIRARNGLTLNQDVKDLPPEKIAEFYLVAQEAANKIHAQSGTRQQAQLRWNKLKSLPSEAFNFLFLNNGRTDAMFLRSIITDGFVSSQVKQEFRNDHLMVVLLTAFIGDRADLLKPHELTADRNGVMFTSHKHNYDMAINTFSHFFISGASLALVFQKLRAQQETNYLPKEDFSLSSNLRGEGFLTGLKNWISFGYSEREKDFGKDERSTEPLSAKDKVVNYMYNLGTNGDVGGIMAKRVLKRFTTIQAGLTMAIFLRTMVGGQDVGTAIAAWSLVFMSGQWFYGWVWDPIQRGNQMIEERIEKYSNELKDIKYRISTGLKNSDYELAGKAYHEMIGLYEKYNPKALGKLEKVVGQHFEKATGVKLPQASGAEKGYYGLMARIAIANKEKNQAEFDQAIEQLRRVLIDKQGFNKALVDRLNAESLLEFSLSNPPVYSHPNKFLSEFFTWNGAVWSTYLYIPLSIMLFSVDGLSTENLIKWFFISSGLYLGSWALFGKTPWLAYEKLSQNTWILHPESLYYRLKSRFERTKLTPNYEKEAKARVITNEAKTSEVRIEAPAKPKTSTRLTPVGGTCSSLFL